jgi:hypothetical protein
MTALTPQILRDATAYIGPGDFTLDAHEDEHWYSCLAVGECLRYQSRKDKDYTVAQGDNAFTEGHEAYEALLHEVGALKPEQSVLDFGEVTRYSTKQEIRYMLMLFMAHYLEGKS